MGRIERVRQENNNTHFLCARVRVPTKAPLSLYVCMYRHHIWYRKHICINRTSTQPREESSTVNTLGT